MAAEIMPRIFEPFHQGNSSVARTLGGLGIGLSIVKKVVELHRGRVEVHSAGPGKGSEFIVHLPAARATSEPRAETIDPALSSPSIARRVLIVDDNIDGAESMAIRLRLTEHEVRIVNDGPSAIEAATAFKPEVVVLDIGLPGMDGYEVARQLRRDPMLSRSLFIALTGYGQEQDRDRAREAGFDIHFTKPIDFDTFVDALKISGS
jgi:CheY-like chemotaxis protein